MTAERTIILHGHIFKNAGSTLDWSLRREFGDGFLEHLDDRAMWRQSSSHLAELFTRRPWIRALSSHHLPPDVQAPDGLRYLRVFLLRHPVERVLSVYEYERAQEVTTPGASNAKTMTASQYIEWRLADNSGVVVRDYQTRYLAGITTKATRPVDERDFERACSTLATAQVGIVARYDESMVVFEEAMRSAGVRMNLAYVRQNSNPDHVRLTHEEKLERLRQLIGDDLFYEVARRNRFDLELYRRGVAGLDTRLECLENREDRLADFRQRREVRATSESVRLGGTPTKLLQRFDALVGEAAARHDSRPAVPQKIVATHRVLRAKLERIAELESDIGVLATHRSNHRAALAYLASLAGNVTPVELARRPPEPKPS